MHVYCTSTPGVSWNQQISIYINLSPSDSLRDARTMNGTLQHHEMSGLLWLSAGNSIYARMAQDSGSTLFYNLGSGYAQGNSF